MTKALIIITPILTFTANSEYIQLFLFSHKESFRFITLWVIRSQAIDTILNLLRVDSVFKLFYQLNDFYFMEAQYENKNA